MRDQPTVMTSNSRPRRALFVSTRICGTDGVSLEIGKWTTILQRLGVESFFLSGRCDRPAERSRVIELANFRHPTIQEINAQCCGVSARSRAMTQLIEDTAAKLKVQIYRALDELAPDVVISENALTLPIHVPLGIALDQVLTETQLPCLVHHHDFAWERDRYLVNALADYIGAHFPPRRSRLIHVVINTRAQESLGRRTGLSSWVIPNVMDFHQRPDTSAHRAAELRHALGIRDSDTLLLQPTRVVARKGIEHSIELARALADRSCKLVISHARADEGPQYARHLQRLARYMGVDMIFAGHLIGAHAPAASGSRYSIADAYQAADLVTFPSSYEGFGNAFLEAIYYRRPIFCNRYTIFQTDIEPLGFDVPMMDGFLDQPTIDEVRSLLDDPERQRLAGELNFELGKRHFSMQTAAQHLDHLLPWCSALSIPKTHERGSRK